LLIADMKTGGDFSNLVQEHSKYNSNNPFELEEVVVIGRSKPKFGVIERDMSIETFNDIMREINAMKELEMRSRAMNMSQNKTANVSIPVTNTSSILSKWASKLTGFVQHGLTFTAVWGKDGSGFTGKSEGNVDISEFGVWRGGGFGGKLGIPSAIAKISDLLNNIPVRSGSSQQRKATGSKRIRKNYTVTDYYEGGLDKGYGYRVWGLNNNSHVDINYRNGVPIDTTVTEMWIMNNRLLDIKTYPINDVPHYKSVLKK